MSNDQKPEHRCDEETITSQSDENSTPIAPIPEIGGSPGLEPTRYGDWEKKGRCIDF